MVARPLDVEHAPELVDLGFLSGGLGAGCGRQRDQRGTAPPWPVSTRMSTAAVSLTNGSCLSASRYCGSVLSFAENDERLAGRAGGDLALEGAGLWCPGALADH